MSDQIVTTEQQQIAYPLVQGLALIGVGRTEAFALVKRGAVRTFQNGRRRYVSRAALLDLVAQLERESAQRGAA